MLVGPVFSREVTIAPRRPKMYITRSIYAVSLLVLMATAWLMVTGTQRIGNIGDIARFGSILFRILAPLQVALVLFMAALQSASAVAQEKDKKTLILLLLTRMTNSELVLGKLFASLVNVSVMLIAATPIFMFVCLFGGTSFAQVGWTMAVTFATALVAGSLGSTLALWREKTFQTLAMTAIIIVVWLGLWELVAGMANPLIEGFSNTQLASYFNPIRAITAITNDVSGNWMGGGLPFILSSVVIAFLLNGVAIWRVRKWNPNREIRTGQQVEEDVESESVSIFGKVEEGEKEDESRRSSHVDARVRTASRESREVWDNPVLWRESMTWAYGPKIIFVRLIYVLMVIAAGVVCHFMLGQDVVSEMGTRIPEFAKPLAPLFLVSLVIVNALAVNTITNERDGRSLDLLLVTDLSPKEFIFGKILGVLYVAKEMVILPMLLCVYLCIQGAINVEILIYLLIGLAVMNIFVTTLGIHCGMIYSNSRQAIGVSIGTVFFLSLGIVTSMVMMVSFAGSFERQLAPFLAFIVGGGVGLYVALGYRNPSRAIAFATGLLPVAMFFVITSLLLEKSVSVFLVICAAYGFTTIAMLVPALSEYNIAMGRSKSNDE